MAIPLSRAFRGTNRFSIYFPLSHQEFNKDKLRAIAVDAGKGPVMLTWRPSRMGRTMRCPLDLPARRPNVTRFVVFD